MENVLLMQTLLSMSNISSNQKLRDWRQGFPVSCANLSDIAFRLVTQGFHMTDFKNVSYFRLLNWVYLKFFISLMDN